MEQIIIREDGTKVLQTTVSEPVVTTISVDDLQNQIATATIARDDSLTELKKAQDYAAEKQTAFDDLTAQLASLQTKLADPLIPVTDLQTSVETVTVETVQPVTNPVVTA